MLNFLQPIWLWAISGIIVPVIIHLWNVKGSKTLKVGSIALFVNSAPTAARSLKITDLLLLLLRCLLLIVLAMLIAKPFWNEQKSAKERGWILIEKSEIKNAYKSFQPLMDSLLEQGFAFHYFDESFEKADLQDAIKTKDDSTNKSSLSYWTLLKIANKKVPQNCPVYLFTDNQLQRLKGARPDVFFHLKWFTFSSLDTSAKWLKNAYSISTDSIRVVEAASHSFGTNYSYQNISLNNVDNDFKINKNKENLFITSNDFLHQTVEIDTATTVIAIYVNQFFEDANYVQAAINAIKDFTRFKIKVIVANNVANIPSNYNWLFWLSEDAMPVSIIKNNVFVYEKGKPEMVHSSLFADDNNELTTPENISLYKYIKTDSIFFQPIWKNGYGETILNEQKEDASVYHFYTRFNPQWNDLVWSHSFPQLMYELIFDNENNSAKIDEKDKRAIDATQMQPVFDAQPQKNLVQNQTVKTDLSRVFWCLAFCLFFIERILSFTTKKSEV